MPRRLLFDLEGNGLLPGVSRIHCIAACDPDTGERMDWGPDQLPQALEVLDKADTLVAHFGLGYDFPALAKVLGFHVPHERQRDSVVIARLIFADIKERDGKRNDKLLRAGKAPLGKLTGSHSLEAWGARLGVPKTEFTGDWDHWSPEMHSYMIDDVSTLHALWKALRPDDYSQVAIELEHKVARLCHEMSEAGWPFDVEAAGRLHAHLLDEKEKLEQELKKQFPGWTETYVTPKKKIEKTRTIPFNPKSRQHIERALREQGWEPREFTPSGQAKLDEAVIESLALQFPQAASLAHLLMLEKRLGQLVSGEQAWLKHVADDGRIHGQYNPMGTVTSRAAHHSPNLGQVPAGGSPYGKECRALFTVPPGWKQVGADMSGLELRCLAHYIAKYDNGAYGKLVTEGDVHWANVLALEIATGERNKSSVLHNIYRDQGAKRALYAWLYGAGDFKFGSILLDLCRSVIKVDEAEGERLFATFFAGKKAPKDQAIKKAGSAGKYKFMSNTPGLSKLITTVQTLGDRGFLPGLDGRKVPVRSQHAALNTLLQSAGAILCKQWITSLRRRLDEERVAWGPPTQGSYTFLGWIHDELQIACRPNRAEWIAKWAVEEARKAGEPFGFRVPLDGEARIGANWAECH